jgi:hypothetical protein
MKKVGAAAAMVLAAGFLASNPAQAITYGIPDCVGSTCGHPNVVMLAGLRTAGGTGVVCSGTLIDNVDGYYLFLTAGHCTSLFGQGMATGEFSSIGVSFDGVVARIDPPDGLIHMDPGQFAGGGVPVTTWEFGPSPVMRANDYGIVSVPATHVDYKWPNAKGLDFVTLADEVQLNLDLLVASIPRPQQNLKFYAVGYGSIERLNVGSNAGGLIPPGTGTGTRRVAEMQGFDNLRKTLFQTSQNPALGNDGTCYGDSGGPAFYMTASGPVQVGITSSGDAVCRATGTYARTDIEAARTFIDCARAHPGNVKACGF